jgi:hypothetical protein
MATAEDNLRVAPPRPALDDGADLPRVRFVVAVAQQRYVHVAHDRFPGALDAATAADLGDAELIRARADGGELEAFVRLPGDLACLLDFGWGRVVVEVRARLHRPEPPPAVVPFAFWSRGPRGGEVRHRDVEAAGWDSARANYPARVAGALDALMELREPRRGRLLVWRGPPGTGKTSALRALAAAWREWCTVHYVLDPASLMGADPRYLLDVLTWEDDGSRAWRLLVLEDAGELIVHDAGRTGALATLLNTTDGILGQGTGTLVLVTTNEPVGHLHPAVRRRGRCLADIEFAPLSREESAAWLRRAGCHREPDRPHTLAELFALAGGAGEGEEVAVERRSFGFGRALDGS